MTLSSVKNILQFSLSKVNKIPGFSRHFFSFAPCWKSLKIIRFLVSVRMCCACNGMWLKKRRLSGPHGSGKVPLSFPTDDIDQTGSFISFLVTRKISKSCLSRFFFSASMS